MAIFIAAFGIVVNGQTKDGFLRYLTTKLNNIRNRIGCLACGIAGLFGTDLVC